MINKYYRIFCSAILPVLIMSLFAGVSCAQQHGEADIRLNQIGFYPNGPKIAIILGGGERVFQIQTIAKKMVFTGTLKKSVRADLAGKHTLIADFSIYRKPGKYIVSVPGIGSSYPFQIKRSVHHNVAAATIKAYYFMRASIPLYEKFAGKWHRAEGHPDTAVLDPSFGCYGPAPWRNYHFLVPRLVRCRRLQQVYGKQRHQHQYIAFAI